MKFEEVCVLLPCHSLEDFPTHYEGTSAEGLLAAWSAMWHPALLAATGRLPTWYRAEGPPDALSGRLIIIPPTSEPLLLAGWVSRATNEGAHVVRKLTRRGEIVSAALAGLDEQPRVDPELVADFLALGYGYLAVELLTRQMRYMSNIDEVHLQNEALAGGASRDLHFFGPPGLLGMFVGGGVLAFLLLDKIIWQAPIMVQHGPLLILGMMLCLFGVQLLAVGLVGELVMRTHFESRENPMYRVESVLGASRVGDVAVRAEAKALASRQGGG